MKKLAIAIGFALTLPLIANADIDLTAVSVTMASAKNTYIESGKGICYSTKAATLKQSTKITPAVPGFQNLGGVLSFTTSGQPNDPFTWSGDMLLDMKYGSVTNTPVTLTGTIVSRKGDKLVLSFNPTDQLAMATALLAYSDSYPELLANASLDPNPKSATKTITPYVMTFNAKNGSIVETSYIKSFDGPCQIKATIKRRYRN